MPSCYQPKYDRVAWDDAFLEKNMVYFDADKAAEDFPGLEIMTLETHSVKSLSWVDTPTISEESKKNYVNALHSHCPICFDEDIEAGSIEVDGNTAFQEVHCNACSAEWNDLYKLVGVEERT